MSGHKKLAVQKILQFLNESDAFNLAKISSKFKVNQLAVDPSQLISLSRMFQSFDMNHIIT